MSAVRKYVVIRAHPDLPDGFLPPDMEGRWFDVTDWVQEPADWTFGSAVAVDSGRFERRDDGATARVFEVRP